MQNMTNILHRWLSSMFQCIKEAVYAKGIYLHINGMSWFIVLEFVYIS